MKCGFFELDITPPLGSIIPGSFAARYADEILDPLFVRAFAVKSENSSLAVASVDACGITADITEQIRCRVSKIIPMKPSDIMVMATHAHGGGPTLNWGEEVVTDSFYLKSLVEKTADAIIMAWKNAEESEFSVGTAELNDVSFIRVYQMKDGSLKTNPGSKNADKIEKATAETDPEVLVLAVCQNGIYKGALINFANHPAIVATTQISGDYISVLSNEMKRIYGSQFVSVFINGACGNINHLNPFDAETYKKDRHHVVGTRLAETVKKVIDSADAMTETELLSCSESIDVKLRKPSASELVCAKEMFNSFGDELISCTPSDTIPSYVDMFFALQAFLIQADKRTQRKIDLQVFKIGSCYIFGIPCQIFVEFGKKIKNACAKYSFISAFANDYCGYVPTPECMKEGVYEARLAPTSALEPAAGNKICDAVIEMYNKMK